MDSLDSFTNLEFRIYNFFNKYYILFLSTGKTEKEMFCTNIFCFIIQVLKLRKNSEIQIGQHI